MDVSILSSWSLVGLIIDALILVWLIFSFFGGAKTGFVYTVLGLGTFIIALAGAWFLSDLAADPLTKLIRGDESAALAAGISYDVTRRIVRAVAGIVLVFILGFVVRIFAKGLSGSFNKIPVVGSLNRVLGAFFGFLATLALIFALLIAWKAIFPQAYEDVLKGAPLTRLGAEHNILANLFGIR